MDKVAIYCRLSKEDVEMAEGGISESIQNQKLLLTDYAINQGWHIYHIYCDEDLRGFDRDRPAFRKMLKAAEKGEFNIILCKHQSRFTRDMELVEKYIHGRFVLWGIRFVSLIDNVDTNMRGNKKARQINGLMNEWYSEDLSENIRAVFKKKMEDGQFIGSFACYGYMKNPEDKHKLIVDPEAAAVVKEIFSLYLEGNGCAKIANILTERGILTPTQYKKHCGLKYVNPSSSFIAEKYSAWNPGTVKRILSNAVYIGTMIQGREKKVSYKSKKVVIAPKSEWIVIPNNHQPIIDEDQFNTVKQLIENNRRTCRSLKKPELDMPNIFAGKLKCGDCGANLQRSGIARDKSTYYYRCAVSARTKRQGCTPHGIRQDIIEQAVLSRIQGMIEDFLSNKINQDNLLAEILQQLEAKKSNIVTIKGEIAGLDKQIRNINILATKAYTDKLKGHISEEEFQIYKSVFDDEKMGHEQRKTYLIQTLATAEKNLNKSLNISSLLDKQKKMVKLDYDIINDFIDTIEIAENEIKNEKQIIINWNI